MDNDVLEYIVAISCGFRGLLTLSSGKQIWIEPPRSNPCDIGISFKKLYDRLKC